MGPIAQLTCAEVRQVRIPNGETVPLLQEVLDLLGDHDVWVEVKGLPGAHDRALLAVLDAGPAPHRYAVHSLDHRIIRRLGEERPGLPRGSSYRPIWTIRWEHSVPSARRRSGRNGSSWTKRSCTRSTRPVAVSTPGRSTRSGDLEYLVRLGVDGLCGNYPDRIRVALAARGGSAARV